jgi:HSP20 family protein
MEVQIMKSLMRRKSSEQPAVPANRDWMLDLHQQMDQLFNQFWDDFGLAPRSMRMPWKGGNPFDSFRIDVSENDKAITVKADLPGVEEKDINVTLEHGVLTIEGEHSEQNEEKDDQYHITERRMGRFSRAIPIPEELIDESKIKAKFKHGVLKVSLPKVPGKTETARRIKVETA